MTNARIIFFFFFWGGGGGGGSKCLQRVIWFYLTQNMFFEQYARSIVCIWYSGKSAVFWKCWIYFVNSRFFTGGTTKNQESQKSARWRNLHAWGTRWPYRVTASDDHWQLPRGDNENLTIRASCFARCTESVYEGFVHPRTFLVRCRWLWTLFTYLTKGNRTEHPGLEMAWTRGTVCK